MAKISRLSRYLASGHRSERRICEPNSERKAHGTEFKSKAYTSKGKKKRHSHTGCRFSLEVQAGFEPADNGVADRGLTTWLLHQNFSCHNIIAKILVFVNSLLRIFEKEFAFLENTALLACDALGCALSLAVYARMVVLVHKILRFIWLECTRKMEIF